MSDTNFLLEKHVKTADECNQEHCLFLVDNLVCYSQQIAECDCFGFQVPNYSFHSGIQ